MKICYLHIGPYKTASSTLQTMLATNEDALERHGLHYPGMGAMADRNKRHNAFATEMLAGTDTVEQLALRDALKKAGLPDRIVVSAETLSRAMDDPDARDRLAKFFSEIGYSINLIAYIRPQLLSVNSFFTQRLKTLHGGENFERFVTRFTRAKSFDHLSRYSELIGDPRFNLNFAPFNSATLRSGICFDFLNRLDVNAPEQGGFAIPDNRNITPGPKTVAGFLRIARFLQKQKVTIAKETRTSAVHALRSMAQKQGWNSEKFNGLTSAHKKTISEKFSLANDRFAQTAWSRSWREIFGEDEDAAMNKPTCRFLWGKAAVEERLEVQDFVSAGIQLVAPQHNKRRSAALK